MQPTNQQLYELSILFGRQIISLKNLVMVLIESHESMNKFIYEKLPGLNAAERQFLLNAASRNETASEHLEKSFAAFQQAFEKFPKP